MLSEEIDVHEVSGQGEQTIFCQVPALGMRRMKNTWKETQE